MNSSRPTANNFSLPRPNLTTVPRPISVGAVPPRVITNTVPTPKFNLPSPSRKEEGLSASTTFSSPPTSKALPPPFVSTSSPSAPNLTIPIPGPLLSKSSKAPELAGQAAEMCQRAVDILQQSRCCLNTSSRSDSLYSLVAGIITDYALETIIVCDDDSKVKWDQAVVTHRLENVFVYKYKQITTGDASNPPLFVNRLKDNSVPAKISFERKEDYDGLVEKGILLILDDCHTVRAPSSAGNKAIRELTSSIMDSANSSLMMISDRLFSSDADIQGYWRLMGIFRETDLYEKKVSHLEYPGLREIIEFSRSIDPETTKTILGTVTNKGPGQIDVVVDTLVTKKSCSPLMKELYRRVLPALTIHLPSPNEIAENDMVPLIVDRVNSLPNSTKVIISVNRETTLAKLSVSFTSFVPLVITGQPDSATLIAAWFQDPSRKILLTQEGLIEPHLTGSSCSFHLLRISFSHPGILLSAAYEVISS